jgi:GT2 family glycosyltransferase
VQDVLVVVLNYRVAELTLDCVAALAGQVPGHAGCRVVVVDNDSRDGSAEKLAAEITRRGWRDWVSLIRSPVNGGFSAGNNLAIRAALASPRPPRYVLILNPDTLPRPGAVRALHDFLEAHPEVGIAGSRLEEADGTQHQSRYRFPSLWGEFDARLGIGLVTRLLARWQIAPPLVAESHPIDWVAGASMMIRSRVFADVGLLDEGYFLYFEELDFCRRAQRAGWLCWYVYESRVAHLVGRSSGIDVRRRETPPMPPYWFQSRRRYFVKNHGLAYACAIDALAVAGLCFSRTRELFGGRRGPHPDRFLRDLVRTSVWWRGRRGLDGSVPPAPPLSGERPPGGG